MTYKTVMVIAGSDSGCIAGIQSDLKTLQHLQIPSHAVITAITAQNNHDVFDIHYLPEQIITNQINAATVHDCVLKIGMLGSIGAVSAVQNYLSRHHYPVILDPVLMSSSGHPLFAGDMKKYCDSLMKLLPNITILTPNILEAEILLQRKIHDYDDVVSAANEFIEMGINTVLIKGGHFSGDFSQDFWTNGNESCWISSPRLSKHVRGTGCVLASATSAALAQGYDIKDALVLAKMYMNRGFRQADVAARQLYHQDGWPDDEADLPSVLPLPEQSESSAFKRDEQFNMGIYPIVDNANWLQKLLPLGIKHVQLRIKNLTGNQLEDEIKKSVQIANKYHAKLFINDYWQLAIKHGAYGVHLGQEDLIDADVAMIHASGLRLGISTHSYFELARAHAYRPSYIAFGPVYHTDSKLMSFAPQGIEKLSRWRKLLQYPLVAIGGISEDNIDTVAAVKVDGIAMISAISHAQNPLLAASKFMKKVTANAA